MEKMTIKEILSSTKGTLLSGNTNQTINSVCVDTRNLKEGSLFIPLKGKNCDGHIFIKEAFEKGAAVCLVDKNFIGTKEVFGPLIQVDSTLDALQNLAEYYRKKFDILVIGVTGSVGKTTTKEMIASVLSESMEVFKTEENFNGQIGLPLTIFNLNSNHKVAVLEMGISKIGEMDRLAKIAQPDIGVITNIGLSHIENLKSVEKTCEEKSKIVFKDTCKLYVNGDSPLLSNIKTNAEIIRFGINGAFPYKCEDICLNNDSTTFVLCTSKLKENITIPCLGIHNVYNALAAISIAMDIGMHIDDIKKGLLKFKNVNMRQQIINLENIILINDSYNASPDSLKSSVSILKNLSGSGKNIIVIADMLELGSRSENIHFETGRYIAMEKIDILITIGNNSKFLAKGAKSVNQNIATFHYLSNEEAIQKLKEIITPKDKILVKGSRSMHTEDIVEALINNYDKIEK